ncbi:helix-turn-helix domain-containing protein [Aeromonas caviae]
MINQWMSAKEIAALPGMPSTIQGVHKKAKRDGWQFRKQEGVKGPGIEYLIEIERAPEEVHPSVRELPAVYLNQFMEEFVLLSSYKGLERVGGIRIEGDVGMAQRRAFPRMWLKRRGFDEKDLAIFWGTGDSMEPTISNNDTLVVHLGRTRPVDGHIYVVRNFDQFLVKRLQVLPGAVLLLCDNQRYQPIELANGELHTFELIGQVVHIARDVGE